MGPKSRYVFFFLFFISFAQSTELPNKYLQDFKETRWYNSWSSDQRKQWYRTVEGSYVLPMDIFLNLKTADRKQRFASRENLSRYGFIYPPVEDSGLYTIHRLPLGFVEEANRFEGGRKMMGYNCAMCHTAKMEIDKVDYILEGASGSFDFQTYSQDLYEAVESAARSKLERDQLFTRIELRNPSSPYLFNYQLFNSDLQKAYKNLLGRTHRTKIEVDWGPSRLDAFALVFNELATLVQKSETATNWVNYEPSAAPVSIPHIWSTHDHECVQTNCLAQDPLKRNIGQTLGVFAQLKLNVGARSFQTSTDLHKLHVLENALATIRPPKWREDLLGELDQELIRKGKSLYFTKKYSAQRQMHSCASCHVISNPQLSESLTPPNKFGKSFLKSTQVHYQEVGTDPSFMELHNERTFSNMKPHLKLIYDLAVDRKTRIPYRSEPLAVFTLGMIARLVSERFFLDNSMSEEQVSLYQNYTAVDSQENVKLTHYKARPLDGIVFSAPYLHNGSIPNLTEFFKAPNDRVRSFPVGSSKFDSKNLGFDISQSKNHFILDTTIKGNWNTGHIWGSELSDKDKLALIEFLKTL